MSPLLSTLALSALLTLSAGPATAAPPTPTQTPPAPDAPVDDSRAQALIGELLNNVDWKLLLRVQQNLLANLDLLVPYTEEYLNCLEAEGSLDKSQPLSLKSLLGSARNASQTCNVILQSLAGKLNFDLTEQELNEGLSPEYRELLKKSL